MNDSSETNDRRQSRLERVLADLRRRLQDGKPIDAQSVLQEHADLAEPLREFFAKIEAEQAEPLTKADGERTKSGSTDAFDPHETVDHSPSQPPAAWQISTSGTRRGPGTVFGDFELLEEIGRGGMGIVYKARQISLNRIVAVKMILAGGWASDKDLQRFRIEARAAGKLDHANIVTIYQIGEVDGHHFFSMDFVEGHDLDHLARDSSLAQEQAARYLKIVAEAIHIAHEHGILHRDLKPANVLIDQYGQPQVTDFGLAKHVDDDSKLTASGATVGTPCYMSPEQAAGKPVTRATDVYSLGAILFTLLTGRPPFERENVVDTILDVIHKQPESPTHPQRRIHRDLQAICLKCLDKDPAERYATAQDLADDLDRFLAGEAVVARPMGRVRRCLYWLREVPIIAALTGKTVTHPTVWHRRVQWIALATLVFVGACLTAWFLWPDAPKPMPPRIRIASARQGGQYFQIGTALQPILAKLADRPVEVLETNGSEENSRLLNGEQAELALLQTGAMQANGAAVVAPLYYEYVHVVVRDGLGISSLADLKGRAVSIGLDGSGMQLSAKQVLQRIGVVVATDPPPKVHFTEIETNDAYDAAIVTTGSANSDLNRLLAGGKFNLVALSEEQIERLTSPILSPRTIHRGTYRTDGAVSNVPNTDIHTVATTTFLAVRKDASDRLVQKTLEAIYMEGDLVQQLGLIPFADVAQWTVLDFHPAARKFFFRPAH